jgi:hypothetical protein
VLKELVFQVFGVDAAAASAPVELSRSPFGVPDRTVNRDDVRGRAVFGKGQVVGVR